MLLRLRQGCGVLAPIDMRGNDWKMRARQGSVMLVMPKACPECGAAGGQPHVQSCSFHQRYEAARGPLIEWLASLPAEYERLKVRAAADAFANDRFDES